MTRPGGGRADDRADRRAATVEALEERRLFAWGAFPQLVNQDLAAANYPNLTGAGESVAVLDTGIDYQHPGFSGGSGPFNKVVAFADFVGARSTPYDPDGHGTGVAGVIAANPFTFSDDGRTYQGVAPGVNLVSLRTEDSKPTTSWAVEGQRIADALQWVIDHRAQYNIVAVNISSGYSHFSQEGVPNDSFRSVNQQISAAAATLASAGVFIVASSGNDGAQTPYGIEYPGSDPNVYAAGSVNASDVISTFTERGSIMDLLAPGENVPTTYYDPSSGTHEYLAATGTSFSAPYLAGAAALLKQVDPTLTPAEIIRILKDSGVSNFDGDREARPYTGLTWPRLDLNAAIALAYRQRDDAFEANDSAAAATPLTFSGNSASLGGLKLLLGNTDFYKFTLAAQSDVSVGLSTDGSYQPTFDLLNGGGAFVARVGAARTVTLAAGTYYLRVTPGGASLDGSYGLAVTRTTDDPRDNHTTAAAADVALANNHGSLAGLTLAAGANDYYTFTVPGASSVTIAVQYGGASAFPTVQLLNSAGSFVSTVGSGGLTTQLAAGKYYVRLTTTQAFDGTFGLSVDLAPTNPQPAPATVGANGTANGVAVGADGTLYLAYYDTASQTLKYATRGPGGAWSGVSVIDATPLAGKAVSLALDNAGLPGVAYLDAGSGHLKYAHFDGSAWSSVLVDGSRSTGLSPTLLFSHHNQPVIAYYSYGAGDLRFAQRNGSAWQIDTVDSAGDVGAAASLALNPAADRWSIGYSDTTRGTLKFAERRTTGWRAYLADAALRGGASNISLAFSPAGRAAMTYLDVKNDALKYVSAGGGRWSSVLVTAAGHPGAYGRLHFTPAGRAEVLYYSAADNGVYFATAGGGGFRSSLTAAGGGTFLSAAYDANDDLSFVWRQGTGLVVTDV